MDWEFEDEMQRSITPQLFSVSRVIDGVRMYPVMRCEQCGDHMKHDDDGPRLCRWCQQSTPPVPEIGTGPSAAGVAAHLTTKGTAMLAATILDALAHDYFKSLTNEGTHWRLTYKTPDETGEMKNKTLDKLLEDWADYLDNLDGGT